jgi:hypothetical protein
LRTSEFNIDTPDVCAGPLQEQRGDWFGWCAVALRVFVLAWLALPAAPVNHALSSPVARRHL